MIITIGAIGRLNDVTIRNGFDNFWAVLIKTARSSVQKNHTRATIGAGEHSLKHSLLLTDRICEIDSLEEEFK